MINQQRCLEALETEDVREIAHRTANRCGLSRRGMDGSELINQVWLNLKSRTKWQDKKVFSEDDARKYVGKCLYHYAQDVNRRHKSDLLAIAEPADQIEQPEQTSNSETALEERIKRSREIIDELREFVADHPQSLFALERCMHETTLPGYVEATGKSTRQAQRDFRRGIDVLREQLTNLCSDDELLELLQ